MQNFKFILVIVLVVTFPNIPQAKMYKWVDQNGKVTYSNVAPPSSAQKVETFKETTESPMDRDIRIENERIQSEEDAALKEYQKEQKRVLKEEQKRIVIENAGRSRQENNAASNAIAADSVSNERRILEKKRYNAMESCRRSGKKLDSRKSCVKRVKRKYRNKIANLEADSEGYFTKKRYDQQMAPIRKEVRKETHRNSTINGEWDTQGRHYTPAGGGNAWRDDGTFMQKAAGGYIDTENGEFVPAN